ncbi:hypothetical protein SS50377_24602 [Spironucleus salmonicida]|uniref:Uncharacterized protein n=1 Tax=Spironucleus salmonicida TaxID=348837 RepID=V6LUQ9_9EUKA|nr:hypothetical protein SS50377_24602 [Spironucleus salmonicida]|eukprot:EST44544.1 Hypothetical protein SS50377_15544 [Spironucleus salmonicida]
MNSRKFKTSLFREKNLYSAQRFAYENKLDQLFNWQNTLRYHDKSQHSVYQSQINQTLTLKTLYQIPVQQRDQQVAQYNQQRYDATCQAVLQSTRTGGQYDCTDRHTLGVDLKYINNNHRPLVQQIPDHKIFSTPIEFFESEM